MDHFTLVSHSPDETEEIGRQLGSIMGQGMFLALHGNLGGGKTCFARGIVAGAAPQSAHLVASPTFAIMNEYPGNPPVYHFDFYRMAGGHEIYELGFEEIFHGNGVCIVEWPEKAGGLIPPVRLDVTFTCAEYDQREITFNASGAAPQAALEQLVKLRQL